MPLDIRVLKFISENLIAIFRQFMFKMSGISFFFIKSGGSVKNENTFKFQNFQELCYEQKGSYSWKTFQFEIFKILITSCSIEVGDVSGGALKDSMGIIPFFSEHFLQHI
jgi:hypothetical protein